MLADYGRIVPQALLDLPPHGALNLHPSLLPRHRGPMPFAWALREGDSGSYREMVALASHMPTLVVEAVFQKARLRPTP